MTSHAIGGRVGLGARVPAAATVQLRWLAAGLALGFAVPFLLADVLELPRDGYYAAYVVFAAAFVALWARATEQPLGALLRRRLLLALALGLVFAVLLAFMVVRVEDATPRPGGPALAGAALWRGVVYGAADGLLLSAFPILAVFAAFAGSRLRTSRRGTVVVGAAALAASLAMTAAYHLGYGDFRSSQLRSPVTGDLVWSLPTLVTLNPLGAPVAHAGMHVGAVLHSYHTDLFLPPHR